MARRHAAAVALAGLLLAGAGPVVETDLGPVRGEAAKGAALFRGIPFAAPPVGDLRWRPAQPAKAWKPVRDATRFGPDCPQPTRPGDKAAPQDENCLTVNVFTPDPKAKKLPVLVSIHGGAFFVGSGRDMMETADGAPPPLVREGVVLVSPNYRIGRLGFFAHPALSAEANGATPANFWLSDQIAALQWVQRNIARFGGDPDNVTIVGCSAGGSSVNSLVVGPASRGLFDKASVRSGGGLFNATRPLAVAETQGLEFAARTGVEGRDAAALGRLRGLSVAQVLAGDSGPPNFGAVVDGVLLPDEIPALYARGAAAGTPMLIGSTSDEASIFGLMGFDKKTLKDRFGVDVDALRPAYEVNGPLDDAELLRQVQTDFIFTSATVAVANMAARSGGPAWSYNFDWTPEGSTAKGAPHCADMAYLFGVAKEDKQGEAEMNRLMMGQFMNFVRSGTPNGPGLVDWPRHAGAAPPTLVVGKGTKAVPGFRATQLQPYFQMVPAEWKTGSAE
ncbi:carboxylesterase family protein [Sandaracinobacter sp. RS1-74]|uniref:carboxylesterase/lipase family protein n=1 Tax=Sandaracinobacteroides sayramensis TaxID=2913411 RepID=UPI001EDA3DEF|nr:carboxylesterase family protein [Sandaracinobacteroides sayramensis]MCG2841113.1 carboxylesterase family protein [Sandaracinobacteroides sayramensis]